MSSDQLYLDPEGAAGLDWQDQAACRDTDTNAYFMDGRTPVSLIERCQECPVMDRCRRYALDRPWIQGVWGATTGPERARIRALEHTDVPDQCRRGHALTAESTYLRPRGGWLCRDCDRDLKRERRARRAAA